MRTFVLPLIMCFLVSGCVSVTFTNLAKVSGYETEIDSIQQSHVKWMAGSDTLADVPNDGNIYAVSASQLLSVMKNYPNSMVYLWTPHCTGSACLPLSSVQQICDNRGLELFVVSRSFQDIFTQNTAPRNHPVFIANEHIYRQKRFEDAAWQFVGELIGEENYSDLTDSLRVGRYIFKEGEFVGIDNP